MKIENIFGYTVTRTKCENQSYYRSDEITKTVNNVFNFPKIQNRDRTLKGDSHKGAGLTTVSESYLSLVNLPGFNNLTEWITQQFLLAKEPLGLASKGNTVYYKRSWANRLFRGGHGLCHNHNKVDNYIATLTDYTNENFRPDAVGIFYVDVPEASSNLVIIKDGRPETWIGDYVEEDTHWIQPIEGELLIHSPDVYHAVSIHHNDLPRNVFVFDIEYV